ncbi:MAG: BrnT family toxin [Novosphingobium sp.]
MKISYDRRKRDRTLRERGLDFLDAEQVFADPRMELPDDRIDYGEERYITFGYLSGRPVAVVWTPRGEGRRIISMRHVHERELAARTRALG